jgi:putative RecB family exonuclease
MLSVTPTKFADYLSCPHKYKLRHIEKIGSAEASPALSFGSSIHLALQQLHKNDFSSNPPPAPAELLKPFWNKSAYATRDESELYFNRGCRALTDYCAAFAESTEEIIGTEVFMSFIIQHADLKLRLGCKADRISLDKGGELEVLDYKTNSSGKVPTPEFLENDLPTFIYYVLARITFPQYTRIRITILNVLTMRKVSIRYSPEQITKNKHALWQHLKNLRHSSFPPCASEACSWCQFQDDCPAFNKIVDFSTIG